MKYLLCTSYNKLTDETLQLHNNWIEYYEIDKLKQWGINPDFDIEPEKGISNILEGTMDLPNVVIHVRIVKY